MTRKTDSSCSLYICSTESHVIDMKTPPRPSPVWGGSYVFVDEKSVPPPNWGRTHVVRERGGGMILSTT